MEHQKRICLNCGQESEGNYCPRCGQSFATRRFTMRTFGIHLLSSLTRVSGDLVRTAWGLLRHPWRVVADYVKGKRKGLVSPVSMLLLLALYWGVVMALVPHFSQSQNIEDMDTGLWVQWLYGSLTFQYLFLAIPIAAGTYIVYRSDMRGRFNFAELLIATLYLASTFLLVDFIFSPVELLNEWLGNALIVGVTATYGVISVLKAFPQSSRKKTVLKLGAWAAVTGVLLFVFLILFALPMISASLQTAAAP